MSSLQQRRYIANMIKDKKDDYRWLMEVWASTLHNNEKYPNPACDYTQIILADRLIKLTAAQANYIISAWRNQPHYNALTARNIIIENLIN